MELLIIIIFVVGYFAIALEHPIKINKTASALLTAVICWTIFTVSEASETLLNSDRYLHFIQELGEKAATLSAGELHLEYVGEQLGHHLCISSFYDQSWLLKARKSQIQSPNYT